MRGRFGQYGRGFPLGTPNFMKRAWRRQHRTHASFDGLRQIEVDLGKGIPPLRTPHGLKVVARRRAANKVARASRKVNRR